MFTEFSSERLIIDFNLTLQIVFIIAWLSTRKLMDLPVRTEVYSFCCSNNFMCMDCYWKKPAPVPGLHFDPSVNA